MEKCKWCGTDIPSNRKVFCSPQCSAEFNNAKNNYYRRLKRIAKNMDFNLDKEKCFQLAYIKFSKYTKKKNDLDCIYTCRKCGCAQCIADVINRGKCIGDVFFKKND